MAHDIVAEFYILSCSPLSIAIVRTVLHGCLRNADRARDDDVWLKASCKALNWDCRQFLCMQHMRSPFL